MNIVKNYKHKEFGGFPMIFFAEKSQGGSRFKTDESKANTVASVVNEQACSGCVFKRRETCSGAFVRKEGFEHEVAAKARSYYESCGATQAGCHDVEDEYYPGRELSEPGDGGISDLYIALNDYDF